MKIQNKPNYKLFNKRENYHRNNTLDEFWPFINNEPYGNERMKSCSIERFSRYGGPDTISKNYYLSAKKYYEDEETDVMPLSDPDTCGTERMWHAHSRQQLHNTPSQSGPVVVEDEDEEVSVMMSGLARRWRWA